MVRIDFFTKKDAEYSDYMRYIIANTLQEYEGEVTLNQIPENKATEEEISKYGERRGGHYLRVELRRYRGRAWLRAAGDSSRGSWGMA